MDFKMISLNQQLLLSTITIIILLIALWRIGVRKIKTYPGKFGKIEVWQKYNGEKTLTINNYAQGVSTKSPSIIKNYAYRVAWETVKQCRKIKDPETLMLGLGANTISTLIARLNPKIHQTIVEIDPQIIQACRDYFYLGSLPNYTLIEGDAYKIIKARNSFPKKFNVIIVDIFIGKPPYVDLKSNQPNFVRQLLPHLKPVGALIFNRPGNVPDARNDSEKLKTYLETIFLKVKFFDIQDPRQWKNNVITAQNLK